MFDVGGCRPSELALRLCVEIEYTDDTQSLLYFLLSTGKVSLDSVFIDSLGGMWLSMF